MSNITIYALESSQWLACVRKGRLYESLSIQHDKIKRENTKKPSTDSPLLRGGLLLFMQMSGTGNKKNNATYPLTVELLASVDRTIESFIDDLIGRPETKIYMNCKIIYMCHISQISKRYIRYAMVDSGLDPLG